MCRIPNLDLQDGSEQIKEGLGISDVIFVNHPDFLHSQ
jgi:hypothetical protein